MNQQYLLDKLQEEAAEIIQAVSKIRRFGPHAHHPDRTTTNLQELDNELTDFLAILQCLKHTQLHINPDPQIVNHKATLLGGNSSQHCYSQL